MERQSSAARSTLVLGGARSGKSTLAQRLAVASAGADGTVSVLVTADIGLATTSGDRELLDRIDRHRADRPAGWRTIEAPVDLVDALDPLRGTVVIDCVTMWLSALLFHPASPDDGAADEGAIAPGVVAAAESEVTRLATLIADRQDRTIVVSNEVGQGLVPPAPLGRQFRDLQGRANQVLAAHCDRAVLVVAGRVVPLTEPHLIFEELS